MKKLHTILILIIIISACFIYLSFKDILKIQHTATKIILIKQVASCGKDIETNITKFKYDLRYWVSLFSVKSFFTQNQIIERNCLVQLKLFYSRYQEMIASMQIFNQDLHRTYIRNKKNYFILSPTSKNKIQKQMYNKFTVIKKNKKIFIFQPIRMHGVTVANIKITVNLVACIKKILKRYNPINNSWSWLMNNNMEMIALISSQDYSNKNEFKIDNISKIKDDINDNLRGSLRHTGFYKKTINLLSVYYPVKIFGFQYVVGFSVDSYKLFHPVNSKTMIIIALFIVIIVLMAYLFIKFIINLKNTENKLDNSTKKALELSSAIKKAKKANMAKSEFLANMSHEIRTPLNAVIGMNQLMQRTELSEKQKDYQRKSIFAAQHLLQVINDILDISKIEAKMLLLEEKNFQIEAMLERIKAIVSLNATNKKINLVFNLFQDDPCILVGDSMRLEQVLINLINNAIKFTENNGEIIIAITVKKFPDSFGKKVMLLFSIQDNGIGMDEKQILKIFAPFIQADSSTTRKYGGTGLGLTISKGLVEKMGGRLYVNSKLGMGTTFFFEICLFESETKWIKLEQNISSDKIKIPLFEDYTILIVEDNTINQEVIIGLLQDTKVEIVIAENGEDALNKINKQPFDLILMDLQMPIMDGFTAIEQIKNPKLLSKTTFSQSDLLFVLHNATIPIIAVSAAVGDDDRKKAKKAGADKHITKPIDCNILYKVMGSYLKHEYVNKVLHADTSVLASSIFTASVEGFDIKAGIKHTNNKPDLYHKMLFRFKNQLENEFSDIIETIKTDKKKALQQSHTLKGLASTLGATLLSISASDINTALKLNSEITTTMCNKLEKDINEVERGLSKLLTISYNYEDIKPENGEIALKDIEERLSKNEIINEKLLKVSVSYINQIFKEKKAMQFLKYIENYEYVKAVELLSEVKKKGAKLS